MPHDEFMQRIRKSLYFGQDFCESESMGVSKPLAEYASELFSDTHRGHTLNRLSCVEASSVIPATPAALIMALIYLDRLNVTDPCYVRRITPQELFIVSMVRILTLYMCITYTSTHTCIFVVFNIFKFDKHEARGFD